MEHPNYWIVIIRYTFFRKENVFEGLHRFITWLFIIYQNV